MSRVYIGRLPYDARERDVEDFFRNYGRIREILLKDGFGFVDFDDHRDADDAVYELNGKEMLGERVILEIARGPMRRSGGSSSFGFQRKGNWLDKYGPPTRTEYRLIVENLSSKVSWQDLKDYMRSAGEVTYADAHRKCKNEGVVEFASYRDMQKAYEKLDDTDLSGRRIRLIKDYHDSRRSRSRSRSRSRGRRHSRSRSASRSKSPSKSPGQARRDTADDDDGRRRSPSPRQSRSRSRSASKSP